MCGLCGRAHTRGEGGGRGGGAEWHAYTLTFGSLRLCGGANPLDLALTVRHRHSSTAAHSHPRPSCHRHRTAAALFATATLRATAGRPPPGARTHLSPKAPASSAPSSGTVSANSAMPWRPSVSASSGGHSGESGEPPGQARARVLLGQCLGACTHCDPITCLACFTLPTARRGSRGKTAPARWVGPISRGRGRGRGEAAAARTTSAGVHDLSHHALEVVVPPTAQLCAPSAQQRRSRAQRRR
jgi:hypothetical protein